MQKIDAPRRWPRRLAPLGFAIFLAAVLIAFGLIKKPDPLLFADTDEAMRLVQFRDFIAGQAWRDLVPHRLDPSVDVPMHWSRFVDLSMALLYWPFAAFMPAAAAERVMAIVWPPMMFIVCAIPLTAIARRFGGMRAAMAAVILALAAGSLVQFMPGRIDHHSAQMAAALFAILATMGRNRIGLAAMAGFTTAFALALGIETLPYLIVLAGFFAADFIRGVRLGSVRAYAAALGIGSVALFAISIPPRFYAYTACDVLTGNVLAGVVSGSIGLFTVASRAAGQKSGWQRRALTIGIVGLLAMAASLAVEPRCARGVIGTFDPQIRPLWFDHIEEVFSAFRMAKIQPLLVFQWYFLPMLGLLLLVLRYRHVLCRDDGRVMAACFLAAWAVALFQVRGVFYASLFAIPFIAASLVAWVSRMRQLDGLRTAPILAATALWAFSIGAPQLLPAHAVAEENAATLREDCNTPAALAPLAQLPPGLVLAHLDAGPFILLYTPHSVLSAPYHRFDRGIVLGQSILYTMDLPEAERAIGKRGIDYVVLCEGRKNVALASSIARSHPAWLKDIAAQGAPVRILQVVSKNSSR